MPRKKKTPEIKHQRGRTYFREWRKFRGLNQEEAADRLEIDRSTLSKIENGQVPYNQDFLERLAQAYGCDVSDLLITDPTKPDPPQVFYRRLRTAPREVQEQALEILDILLKKSA